MDWERKDLVTQVLNINSIIEYRTETIDSEIKGERNEGINVRGEERLAEPIFLYN